MQSVKAASHAPYSPFSPSLLPCCYSCRRRDLHCYLVDTAVRLASYCTVDHLLSPRSLFTSRKASVNDPFPTVQQPGSGHPSLFSSTGTRNTFPLCIKRIHDPKQPRHKSPHLPIILWILVCPCFSEFDNLG